MLVFSSTFLFAQEYWEFSVNGKYPEGKKLIQTNYNASSNLWESNLNSAYISLSDFMIDASISRDLSGLDWIYSEVPKIVSRLDQMEGDAAFYSYVCGAS